MEQNTFIYFHLPVVPFDVVARALSEHWTDEQLRHGYRYWQDEFFRRASLVYRFQYERHFDMVHREFRRLASLGPDEWISNQGDPLEEDWQLFADTNGLWAHREQMEAHLASYGVDADVWPATPLATAFTAVAFMDLIRDIWPLWFDYATRTDDEEAAYLRQLPYQDYLNTPYWRRVRMAMLIANRARCSGERCDTGDAWYGSEGDLHVHHLHYQNRGKEQLSNLILLCSRCHQRLHDGQSALTANDALAATL